VVCWGKGITRNTEIHVKSLKTQKQKLRLGLCFDLPIPLISVVGCEWGCPGCPGRSSAASLHQRREQSEIVPEQPWRDVYACGCTCGGEVAEDEKEKSRYGSLSSAVIKGRLDVVSPSCSPFTSQRQWLELA